MKTVKVSHYLDIPPNFTGIIEWHDGSKQWYMGGKLHREDGPAVEYFYHVRSWYLNNLSVYTCYVTKDYIVIEDGLPSTMEWLGEPVSTLKVLTATGICFIPNLPGI
jgi:hypothetical protein